MPQATIHFTQGLSDGGSGQSALGFDPDVLVSMTDDGGPVATSWLWEVISWPAPLAAPPVLTGAATQTATCTPTLDGVYIVRLTRTDGVNGTTVDLRFFGVKDLDNLTLPSPGMTGNMSNVGGSPALAQAAGWAGRADASTNVLVDAYLRWLKDNMGRWAGRIDTINHGAGTPVTETITDSTANPVRVYNLTGAGAYTAEIDTTGVPLGRRLLFLVNTTAGAGAFTIKSGIGGTVLTTLAAPVAGTFRYFLEVICNGAAWAIMSATPQDPAVVPRERSFPMVSGIQSNGTTFFMRAGTVRVDTSRMPAAGQVRFRAILEASTGMTAECQLYNLTDAAIVAGSLLSTSSTTPDFQQAVVTLPSGIKDYEAQIRMQSSGVPGDIVSCSMADLLFVWG